MAAFIKAFLFVVVGEMGDKTQILAMMMAGKYKAKQVLIGVLVATILNHAIAVGVGSYLSLILPMNLITITAGISFLIFGLWSIRGDSAKEEKKKENNFGPILTVAIAFFLAEMGDKTQLMTIAIAAEFRQPLFVLAGTTTGMMLADGIGIVFGAWICKNIQEKTIRWIAGMIFIFFGAFTLYDAVPTWMIQLIYVIPFILVMSGLVYLIGIRTGTRPQPCDQIPPETVP
ncbi:MAG: TMEM165/GDT1 family protein [Anaerolineaceae bacterium]|nr:TMEM165/GDT1 family protein [Anaerolineaceae bacterium]